MNGTIPPEILAPIQAMAAWVWATFGKELAGKAAGEANTRRKWIGATEKYLESLYQQVGYVRILGRREAEPLENLFTHVNLLDRPSAERRYDVQRLLEEAAPRDFTWYERVERVPGDAAVDEYHRLFILGKPGAGKTTFLYHTALRALRGEIEKVPLFGSLKELSDSGKEILPFIASKLAVHGVPEAERFAKKLLKDGKSIVLLDGLDEVNLEGDRRARLIAMLNDFIYEYDASPILLTCRVAATDYSFTQFTYVEMADFDEKQMRRYIDLWFAYDEKRAQDCKAALFSPENEGVRELGQVPILLSLLCLTFEEAGHFPPNRSEIYEEAMRALLQKWDSSRGIQRDEVYKQLSLKRKQGLLAHIAATNFERGQYFLREAPLVHVGCVG